MQLQFMKKDKRLEAIRGAVARGWQAEGNRDKEMDSVLAEAVTQEVYSLLFDTKTLKASDVVDDKGRAHATVKDNT